MNLRFVLALWAFWSCFATPVAMRAEQHETAPAGLNAPHHCCPASADALRDDDTPGPGSPCGERDCHNHCNCGCHHAGGAQVFQMIRPTDLAALPGLEAGSAKGAFAYQFIRPQPLIGGVWRPPQG